jgi:ribosomal protein S27E
LRCGVCPALLIEAMMSDRHVTCSESWLDDTAWGGPIMNRQCSRCGRIFTRSDFVREESRALEADRRAAQLQGVHFFDYRCPECRNEDVFLDVVRLEGESAAAYEARKAELEAKAREVRAEQLDVVVVERKVPPA